jgi:arginase family enzyme
MPLRMILDSGAVEPQDAILLGARSLDPPEREYIASIGLRTDPAELEERSTDRTGVYVALDVDVARAGRDQPFMPEPGGLTLDEVERSSPRPRRTTILGAGFTALAAEPENVETAHRGLRSAWAVTPAGRRV